MIVSIINVFRGNIHQCEIVRALIGQDIFAGNRIGRIELTGPAKKYRPRHPVTSARSEFLAAMRYPSPPRNCCCCMSSNDESSGFFCNTASRRLSKTHPQEQRRERKAKRMKSDSRIPRLTGTGLEKSQRVFENFAELADLRGPHGSLFARRRQVVVEAFLEIPFEQLHALFHADLLGTAPTGLIERLK